MRTPTFFSFMLLCALPCLAQDSWTRKADYPGSFQSSEFSIAGKGYVLTDDTVHNFWMYDPAANTWMHEADFPGRRRCCAASFVVNGKGYIGTGFNYAYQKEFQKDLWEYDPVANRWTQKASFPGYPRMDAIGLSIDNKGYIGLGENGGAADLKDFWQYNPITNTWTQKADFTGNARTRTVSLSFPDKGYVGGGLTQELWQYVPSADAWTRKADLPRFNTSNDALSTFTIGSRGYFITGNGDTSATNVLWEYDHWTDAWTQRKNLHGAGKSRPLTFSLNGKGYAGGGVNLTASTKDFWEYTPDSTINGVTGTVVLMAAVYPNPAAGTLHVVMSETTGDTHIALRDLMGRLLYSGIISAGSHELKIDLGQVSPGVYSLEIRNREQVKQEKIVLQ